MWEVRVQAHQANSDTCSLCQALCAYGGTGGHFAQRGGSASRLACS